MFEVPQLDSVVHGPLRLAVLTVLSTVDKADFGYLKEVTNSTDGNLSANLSRLEEAGYVKSKKHFVGKRTQSVYRISASGRQALLKYVGDLKALLALNPELGELQIPKRIATKS